jgi:hypothetical protein
MTNDFVVYPSGYPRSSRHASYADLSNLSPGSYSLRNGSWVANILVHRGGHLEVAAVESSMATSSGTTRIRAC